MSDTFILLYWLYKLGAAFAFVGAMLLLAAGIFPLIQVMHADFNDISAKINCGSYIKLAIAGLICLALGTVAPDKEELKAYAVYSIGTEVMNSQEAQRLIDAAINYIDGDDRKE